MQEHLFAHSLFAELNQKTGILIDVGAHKGGFLRVFVESGWYVFAFEPDPDNRLFLEKRMAGYRNLNIFPEAVSDKVDKNLPLYTSRVSRGISSLHKFHQSHQEHTRVNTITLSAFCRSHNITNVDILKCDAEAHDYFVLKGFPWETIRPKLVIVEFEDRRTRAFGYSFDDLVAFLKSLNYLILVSEWYPVEEYGARHHWKKIAMHPYKPDDENSWGNIFAFSGEFDINLILAAISNMLRTFSGKIIAKNATIQNLKMRLQNKEKAIEHRNGLIANMEKKVRSNKPDTPETDR